MTFNLIGSFLLNQEQILRHPIYEKCPGKGMSSTSVQRNPTLRLFFPHQNTHTFSYKKTPLIHAFKKTIQVLLFATLETVDSYADTSTLISKMKRRRNYNSIIIYNIFSSLFITITFFLS